MDAGQWSVVETGYGRFLGKLKSTTPNGVGLTQEPEAIFTESIRLESVNIPVPTKGGGVTVMPIGRTSPLIPWQHGFERDTDLHIPLRDVKWYVPVSEDDVTKFRTKLMSRGGGGDGGD